MSSSTLVVPRQYPLYYHESNDNTAGYVDFMEFRLVYEGPLNGSGNKNPQVIQKHAIRRQFHGQLAELWKTHSTLANMTTHVRPPANTPPANIEFDTAIQRGGMGLSGLTYVDTVANEFSRCGYRFVPLVSKKLDLYCALNILFLRRENPGDLLTQGGDIDNRIKTLLDALRMPNNCSEVTGAPEAKEDPFFCLLEDDCLVSELNIVTDRLHKPLQLGQNKTEVMLIIQVRILAAKIGMQNLTFLS